MTRRTPGMPEDHQLAMAQAIATAARSEPTAVEVLVLGAGWTAQFLLPLLRAHAVSFAATTTTGRDGTIPFRFDPASNDARPWTALPTARTVLVTFPLVGVGQSRRLAALYARSRPGGPEGVDAPPKTFYIQLGSTGIFTAPHWNTSASPYDRDNARAQAEDELLALPAQDVSVAGAAVLNLAGLYGGQRDPKAWLPRVIKTKADIAGKKALHLVHGDDVARAVLAAHGKHEAVNGKRWIVNDLHVYDWWDLIYEWSGLPPNDSGFMDLLRSRDSAEGEDKERVELKRAVLDCMEADGVRALPRPPDALGRVLDGRDFWRAVGWWPGVGRVR